MLISLAAVQAADGEGEDGEPEEGFGGMKLKSRSRPDLQPAQDDRTQVRLPLDAGSCICGLAS